MAQLVIKGHPTRGKEIIELLEMLGGNNPDKHTANCDYLGFFIGKETRNIYATHLPRFDSEKVIIYTLEEFLEKFPYKIGDKVQRKGATYCDPIFEVEKMQWVDNHVEYTTKYFWYNNCHNTFTAEYLQPYKEETVEERKYADLRLDVDQDDKLATEATIDGKKITPPENYLIGKVTIVDNGMLVEFVKKQPQYPETYVECAKILECFSAYNIDGYKNELLVKLQELLICRDAYWKIAGEQMGLDKPWKPDWLDTNTQKYCIYYVGDEIKKQPMLEVHHFLAFPTKEMRDIFFENFKDLIEACKEFL